METYKNLKELFANPVETFYSDIISKKAKIYVRSSLVLSAKIINDSFAQAFVADDKRYFVVLSTVGGKYINTCTCKLKGNCEHTAAAYHLFYLAEKSSKNLLDRNYSYESLYAKFDLALKNNRTYDAYSASTYNTLVNNYGIVLSNMASENQKDDFLKLYFNLNYIIYNTISSNSYKDILESLRYTVIINYVSYFINCFDVFINYANKALPKFDTIKFINIFLDILGYIRIYDLTSEQAQMLYEILDYLYRPVRSSNDTFAKECAEKIIYYRMGIDIYYNDNKELLTTLKKEIMTFEQKAASGSTYYEGVTLCNNHIRKRVIYYNYLYKHQLYDEIVERVQKFEWRSWVNLDYVDVLVKTYKKVNPNMAKYTLNTLGLNYGSRLIESGVDFYNRYHNEDCNTIYKLGASYIYRHDYPSIHFLAQNKFGELQELEEWMNNPYSFRAALTKNNNDIRALLVLGAKSRYIVENSSNSYVNANELIECLRLISSSDDAICFYLCLLDENTANSYYENKKLSEFLNYQIDNLYDNYGGTLFFKNLDNYLFIQNFTLKNHHLIITIKAYFLLIHDIPLVMSLDYDNNEQTFVINESCLPNIITNAKEIEESLAESLVKTYQTKSIDGFNQTQEYLEQVYQNLLAEEAEVERKAIKRQSEKLLDIYTNMISILDQTSVEKNIELLPEISVSVNEQLEYTYSITLKVGESKYYIVKDIYAFLQRIEKNEFYSYGKSLEFVHSKSFFDEKSQKLIDILMLIWKNVSNFYNDIYVSVDNPKTFYLNEESLDQILNIYKGEVIRIEKTSGIPVKMQDVYVSLEEKNLEVTIENYRLVLNKTHNSFILAGGIYDYLIEDNSVKKLDNLLPYRTFMRFVDNYPDFNIEYIKKEFSEQIYSRYADIIEADEETKKELDLKTLKINAYFDTDAGTNVFVQTRYYVNDIEISEEEILEKYNQYAKVKQYQNYLTGYGFKDGVIRSKQAIEEFISADLSKLKEVCDVYLSEALKKIKIKSLNAITPHISYDVKLMNVDFENSQYSNEELFKILSAIRKKVKYVKLNEDTIIKIEDEYAEYLEDIVTEFDLDPHHLAEKQSVPLYQSIKLLNDENADTYVVDEKIKDVIGAIANYKNSSYEVPDIFKGILRSYQIEGFKWMKTLCEYNFSGILADDMGLGKTLETIAVISSDTSCAPSLIVCPKSLAYNWNAEFNKWNPNIKVVLVNGTKNIRNQKIYDIKNNQKVIYITSYDSLRNDYEEYDKKFFRFMILDEGQFIKNHFTQKAKSVKQIHSEIRFVLTGTPIENSVLDLWSIFDFLMPHYLYSYQTFKLRYEKDITKSHNKVTIDELVHKITPFVLRRTKEEVLQDLPEKIETIQYAEMTEEQRKLYEAMLLKIRSTLKSKDRISILSMLTRLRQICVAPEMYLEGYDGESSKIELAVGLIKEYVSAGHKVLLFSQFVKAFEIITKQLDTLKIEYFMLTGATEAKDRIEMAEKFNDPASTQKVFLVSLKAGGTGLNLVGADVVIHLDPWWNVSTENQATDRAHRIGQKNVVHVIKLICEDSIEQKVIDLQNAKKDVIKDVISDNDDNITSLSLEDISYLVS